MSPYLATLLTFVIAVAFLRLMDFIAQRGWIESRTSRKLIHIGTGPIFVLCWLMYPDVWISRWLAARRFTSRNILQVRLRAQGLRWARLRLVGAAFGAAVATVLSLYAIWHAGEWLLQRLVFDNEAFGVQTIVILNDGTLPEAEVLRWAGVRRGDNLFALDLSRVKCDLELVPLIRFAAVEREPPNTLRIQVEERQPLARVMAPRFGVMNQDISFVSYCLDAEGYVFTLGEAGLPSQPAWRADLPLPWLRGVAAADEVRPGRTLTLAPVRAALAFLDAFRQSALAGLVEVEGVDLSEAGLLKVEAGASCVTFSYDRIEEQLRRSVTDGDYFEARLYFRTDTSITVEVERSWF